jgi:hypothetical protein
MPEADRVLGGAPERQEPIERGEGGAAEPPPGTPPPPPPPLPVDWPPQQSWREQVRARAQELEQLAHWMDTAFPEAIRPLLDTAREAARETSPPSPAARRARMERAFAYLDAAEVALLRLAPEEYLRGQLPALMTHVVAHLPPSNPERVRVEQFAKTPTAPITGVERASLVSAFAAASAAARREQARLRSFRNIVIVTSLALLVLAAGIAFVGAKQPAWIPLCFAPQTLEKVVCPTEETALQATETGTGDQTGTGDGTGTGAETDNPTGTVASQGTELDEVVHDTAQAQDVGLVMLLGLAAAAVTGAAALRRIRGTSTPFSVPVALIFLKLPTGALTAVLGLLLLGGGFVPGFSALDSSGQIVAWAIVFGAAQQLVTGLVDKKAQTVLDAVGSAPMTADKE